MKESKDKKAARRKLIDSLHHRIRLLDVERQNYALNPNFPHNVRIANRVLVQNDIKVLESILRKLSPRGRRRCRLL